MPSQLSDTYRCADRGPCPVDWPLLPTFVYPCDAIHRSGHVLLIANRNHAIGSRASQYDLPRKRGRALSYRRDRAMGRVHRSNRDRSARATRHFSVDPAAYASSHTARCRSTSSPGRSHKSAGCRLRLIRFRPAAPRKADASPGLSR